jgi:hypothetical protein
MIERLKVEPMILCKDCKHYKAGESLTDDRCMFNAEIDLVRGELYSDLLCIAERDPRKGCRPQALNFVANNPSKSDILTKRKRM